MKTPENFCGLFYLYDLCVCYVFHRVCDILSGRSLNVVGDDERASKHLWKISKHPKNKRCGDGSPDIRACQDAGPKGAGEIFSS